MERLRFVHYGRVVSRSPILCTPQGEWLHADPLSSAHLHIPRSRVAFRSRLHAWLMKFETKIPRQPLLASRNSGAAMSNAKDHRSKSTTCYVDVALLKRHPHEHAAKTLMIDDVDGAHFLCMANLRQPRLALIARRRFLLLKLSDPRNYRSETTILLWKHKSTAIRLVQRGQSISNH